MTPLAILATEEMTIGVRAGDSNFQTFEDLTAYSKAHPGEVNIGGSGTGTDDNVVVGLLNLHTDADVTYVPYISGMEPLSGRVFFPLSPRL